MNKTQQILKEREEEFDKEFPSTYREFPSGKDFIEVVSATYPIENIKSFHTTTLSLLLNSLKEEITQMEQSLPNSKCRNAESEMFGRCFDCEKTKGYNSALSDISALLSETLEAIKK